MWIPYNNTCSPCFVYVSNPSSSFRWHLLLSRIEADLSLFVPLSVSEFYFLLCMLSIRLCSIFRFFSLSKWIRYFEHHFSSWADANKHSKHIPCKHIPFIEWKLHLNDFIKTRAIFINEGRKKLAKRLHFIKWNVKRIVKKYTRKRMWK